MQRQLYPSELKKMSKIVIVSRINPKSLNLISKISLKIQFLKVIFLSDAIFMLLDKRNEEILEKVKGNGSSYYILKNDAEKRGIDTIKHTDFIDYKELIDILFEPDFNIINL